MFEIKVTGANCKALAAEYVEKHLGEQIKFLNNGRIIEGWVEDIHPVNAHGPGFVCYRAVDEEFFSMYFVNDIAKALYRLSRKVK